MGRVVGLWRALLSVVPRRRRKAAVSGLGAAFDRELRAYGQQSKLWRPDRAELRRIEAQLLARSLDKSASEA
jgi:hypothetical protein